MSINRPFSQFILTEIKLLINKDPNNKVLLRSITSELNFRKSKKAKKYRNELLGSTPNKEKKSKQVSCTGLGSKSGLHSLIAKGKMEGGISYIDIGLILSNKLQIESVVEMLNKLNINIDSS